MPVRCARRAGSFLLIGQGGPGPQTKIDLMLYALAILGGSGRMTWQSRRGLRRSSRPRPFGAPSAPSVRGRLGATSVLFLALHRRGHVLTPSEENYHANLHVLKALGETTLSRSTVGSLREKVVPGHVVTPTQLIDRTSGWRSTFFEGGIVAHVGWPIPSVW